MVAGRRASREALGMSFRQRGGNRRWNRDTGAGRAGGNGLAGAAAGRGLQVPGNKHLALSLLLVGPQVQGAPDSWHLQGQSRMVRPGL